MNFTKGIIIFPFLLPINIYLIGDSLGAGLQFSIVRIQETYLGWSIIFGWQEFWYVADGIVTGRSAFSILLWINGVVLLFFAAAILLISGSKFGRKSVIIYGIGSTLLIISTMMQYSPLFHGPAGVAIPIGLPLLTLIGYQLWKAATGNELVDETNDGLGKDNDLFLIPTMTGTAGTDD